MITFCTFIWCFGQRWRPNQCIWLILTKIRCQCHAEVIAALCNSQPTIMDFYDCASSNVSNNCQLSFHELEVAWIKLSCLSPSVHHPFSLKIYHSHQKYKTLHTHGSFHYINWLDWKQMKFKRNLTFWVKAYFGEMKVNSWKFTIEKNYKRFVSAKGAWMTKRDQCMLIIN